ncbi:MAG: 16S rRNA (cytosine(1402)-N(4))-methyltransferase RsmH [Syntrophomonas sp.]
MHQPVLLEETISYLITDLDGIYVDCTVGGGGHLKHLLSRLNPGARVIGLDKDADILRETARSFDFPGLKLVHSDFKSLSDVLESEGIQAVDGIMMDLGVSSFQLDVAERGFSFHEDSGLDMRMNREQAFSARDLVNTYTEDEISDILFRYGEERYARRIARGIVQYRQTKSIDTTLELVEIIKSWVPAAYRRDKHPARRSFQALRIAVNGELDALNEVLPEAVQALNPGGRLCVITFHSLEDRIVKRFMQERSRECICPPGLPICMCNHKAQLGLLTRKPVIPGDLECEVNPRARSARLRVAVKK